jgi:hypothetical protein
MRKKSKRGKQVRIYYAHDPDTGHRLYWTVRLKRATKPVTIDGSVVDAIRGYPGTTVGCHLSNCARAKRNQNAFPHPCLLAAFTKSTALIVTKITKGKPSEAVKYQHSYGAFVDLNDRDVNKTFIKEHPELAEGPFTLRPAREARWFQPKPHTNPGGTPVNPRAVVPRGALQRAVTAGLVTAGMKNMGFE